MGLIRVMFVMAVLCFAAAAEARMYLDSEDHGCADDMNTDDCFGPTVTASSGPTILACQALSGANQKCKQCDPQYVSGRYAGYKKCIDVSVTASCKCNNPNTDLCNGEGACAYY